jgi:hypothetical protein
MAVTTIDEVLAALTGIIDNARANASRVGYFAALYRRVTQSVKDGIAAGRFQNGALVEQLDVVFANRYLDALAQFQNRQRPTRSWAVAFRTTGDALPLIVQQLLVAMNAHINLDLGIAAAAVAPDDKLRGIKPDFDRMNAVLAALVGTVEKEIAEVSPAIHLLEEIGLRTETTIINFSMDKARELAWATAQFLAAERADRRDDHIARLDLVVAALGESIAHPPPPIPIKLAPIRIPESDDIRHIIDVLAVA